MPNECTACGGWINGLVFFQNADTDRPVHSTCLTTFQEGPMKKFYLFWEDDHLPHREEYDTEDALIKKLEELYRFDDVTDILVIEGVARSVQQTISLALK